LILITFEFQGMKLPILILVPRANPFPEYTPPDIVRVLYKTGATFDSNVICDYLRHEVHNYLSENELGNNKATLYLDSAPCHLTAPVKDTFKEIGCNFEFIRKHCTNMHQPFDVCIFGPIKRQLCAKWSHWYLFEDKTYTVHGNVQGSPGYTTVIQWLSDIWRDFDTNIIRNSFDQCGITSQSNLHSALRAVVERNKTFTKFVDDFYEADEIYGLELELSDSELEILMDIDANDEIPSAQVPPTLPTTTPSNQSSSSTPIDANTNASSSTTPIDANTNSNTLASPLVGTTNISAATTSTTPFLDPIQQQIHQHELLKQLNIMNKQLNLLRTQPANTNTNTSVPLENVRNLLGVVANVLPSTSTNAEIEDSSKSKKKPASANPSGKTRGRKPYPLDANGNKIRPEKENKESGQKQKKSKK
jgi:hypothetical protein